MNNRARNKILSLAMAVALLLTILPCVTQPARAEGESEIVDYTVVYWLEKANFQGTPTPGNQDHYVYAYSETLTGTAGETTTVTAISAAAANGSIGLKYAYFQEAGNAVIRGDGTTLINVYCARKTYTLTFNLNDNNVNTTMMFGSNTYEGNGTKYAFPAKYGQDISAMWPCDETAAFTHSASDLTFQGWVPAGSGAGSHVWAAQRLFLTEDMLPDPEAAGCEFEAQWNDMALTQVVNYWVARLDEQVDDIAVFNGIEYVLYSQATAYTGAVIYPGYLEESLSYYHQDGYDENKWKARWDIGVNNDRYVEAEHEFRISDDGGVNWQPETYEAFWKYDSAEGTFTESYYHFFYSRNLYTLSFNTLGGSAVSPMDIKYEQKLDGYEPADPTKDGYVFRGWYLGDSEFDFTSERMPSNNLTLFAKWEEGLQTVLGQTVTVGSGAGTDTDPKTASITVANSVSTLTAADIVTNNTSATVQFGTDIATLGTGDVALSVGDNTVYVEVTAEDGVTKLYYKLTITRASALSSACDVLSVTIPAGATVSGTAITADVANSVSSQVVDITVSSGADWKLYSDSACTSEIANKTMTLAVGANNAYIKVTAEDGTAKAYTVTITRASAQSGGGGGSSSTTTQKTAEIGGVDVNYTIDSSGVVTLKPTTAQLEKLLAAIGSDGVLNIAVSGIDGMKAAVIEIDLTKLTASGKLTVFNFSVLDMELSFPVGTLKSMQKLATTIRFGLKPGSLIFELTDANGKDVNWYDYANPVTISIGYTLPQDISAQQIVMVRGDGSIVPRSWYSGGRVYAKIHEPGTYDAAVKSLGGFTDTAGLWMDEAVCYMAARGIVEGVGNNQFDRSGTITRAHFVTMLMRALDVTDVVSTKEIPVADYDDVPDWAKEYVIIAKALGITLADGDGNFYPNKAITRQEMFYMAYEAMGACGMLPEAFTEQWIIFSDWDGNVKAGYSDAIQNLAKLGLVNGNGDGTLNPNGTSTRAEGAQFLYNILKYDVE